MINKNKSTDWSFNIIMQHNNYNLSFIFWVSQYGGEILIR